MKIKTLNFLLSMSDAHVRRFTRHW